MRGFTLVETVVSLLLLMVALLLGLALVLEQPRVVRRIEAQRAALAALDTTIEALRAGAIPLASAELPESAAWPARSIEVAADDDRPGLFHVRVRARWQVFGHPRERSLETFVWRPVTP